MDTRLWTRRSIGATLLTLGLAVVPAFGQPASPSESPEGGAGYGDDYVAGDYGRIRSAPDGVTILRSEADDGSDGLERGGINAPIFPGDRLETDADQRVEIELAGGSLVRIDRRSEVTFLALPAPYAEFADDTVLQVAEGRIAVSASLGRGEEFRVDTPAASIYPLDDAELRIEVSADGRTRVLSRRGVAEVVGSGGSVLVRGGKLTEVTPGALPYDPEPYNTFATTGFDLWIERREAYYVELNSGRRDATAYENIPEEVQPYYGELSANGSWIHTDDYGYVWSPSGVTRDWRPYYDGYWAYGPRGYFWVSNESWGWAPYHYGRWNWIGAYGWCWSPGRVFAGAWVSWSWGSAYVGWSALDYWNRPCYRSVYYHGYYDPYAWTFVSYRHLPYRDYVRYGVPYHHVEQHVHRSAVVTRPPRVSPRTLADSTDTRQRALRELSEDGRRRMPRATESRPTSGAFRAGEDRFIARDRAERIRSTTGARSTDRTRTAGTARAGRDTAAIGRPVDTDRRTAAGRASTGRDAAAAPAPRYPRRITAPAGSGSSGRSGDRRDSKSAVRPSTSRRTTEGADVRRVEPRGTTDGIRDVYRRATRPRTPPATGARPDAGSSSATAPRSSSTDKREVTTPSRPSTEQARPRSTTPSRSASPTPRRGTGKSGSARPAPSRNPKPKPKPEARPAPKRRGDGDQALRSTGSASPRNVRSAPPPRTTKTTTTTPRARATPSRSSSTPNARSTPSRSSAPKVRSAPSRSSAPKARSAPSRSSAPKARSAPSRSSAPKARSAPSRSSAPKARSAPSRSSGGSRSKGTSTSSKSSSKSRGRGR